MRIDSFEPAELPAKFEAGTPPIVPAIGLGAAIDYLNQIGMETVHAHERRLTRRAHEVLENVEGVTICGPAVEGKAGIVAFTMEGIHAPRYRADSGSRRGGGAGRSSLCDAAAQAAGDWRDDAGQFLSLQHDGGSRPIGRRAESRQGRVSPLIACLRACRDERAALQWERFLAVFPGRVIS